jgi:hypothetical protein
MANKCKYRSSFQGGKLRKKKSVWVWVQASSVPIIYPRKDSSGTLFMSGASLNSAPENGESPPPLSFKIHQHFSKLCHNNAKCPDAVAITVIGVIILKIVLCILLHNAFRLLPINGHDMNKISAEIHFHITQSKQEKVCKLCCPRRPLGSLMLSCRHRWQWVLLSLSNHLSKW